MKGLSKIQRMTAAVLSIAVTFSVVWAMAGYAYPEPSPFSSGELAVKLLRVLVSTAG